MSTTNPHTAAKITDIPKFAPKTGPLAELNQDFHNTYNGLVAETQAKLGTEIPLIITVGDDVELLKGELTAMAASASPCSLGRMRMRRKNRFRSAGRMPGVRSAP